MTGRSYVQGTPTPNYQLPIALSVMSCSDCNNSGRPPAAVHVGTVTHNGTLHTQRLSLATKLSGYADSCQQPLSHSLNYVAIDMVLHAVEHQLYCMQ